METEGPQKTDGDSHSAKRNKEKPSAPAQLNGNAHPFKMSPGLLQSVLDNSPSAVFLHRDRKFIYANPSALALFEVGQLSHILGRCLLDFIHPDYHSVVAERIDRIFETGCHVPPMAQKYITQAGRVIDVQAFGVLVDYEGRPALLSICSDISEHKRAEASLRESEEKYRIAFRTSPDAININRASDGLYIDINEGFTRLTGYPREEAIGRTSLELAIWVDPEDRQRLVDGLRAAGHVENLEARFRRKNGEIGVGLMSARLMRINQEEVILSITRDITERKRTEALLRQSDARFRTAFENTAVGMALIGLDGIAFEANAAMAQMLGYGKGEVIGRNVLDVMHPDDIGPHQALFTDLVAGRVQSGDSERRLIRKDGTVIHAEVWSTVQRDEQGKPLYLIAIVRDISEQIAARAEKERLEVQLLQAQKMEAIGVLAGGIAHDFNNILSAIIGFTELALMGAGTPSEYLAEAMKAANRARELVKQILSFSRQTEKERKPVNVGAAVREIVKFLRASIPTTIELGATIDEDAGAVLADPVELHQVLMNLCTNAVHAIGGHPGSIAIQVEGVTISAAGLDGYDDMDPGRYIRLSVRDSGSGIHPDILSRIFDPYFTTKAKGMGTGLGLAVVHGIVTKSRGAIRVESVPGKGAAFHIYLPQVQAAFDPQIQPATVPAGGTEKILLVDDEKQLVDLGARILKSLGYDVVTRTSPIEALELFKIKPNAFQLVISDQTMPGMTGDTLARELLKINPAIPIILCTGYSQQIDPAKADRIGIKALVMKPLLVAELDGTIRRVLKSGGN